MPRTVMRQAICCKKPGIATGVPADIANRHPGLFLFTGGQVEKPSTEIATWIVCMICKLLDQRSCLLGVP